MHYSAVLFLLFYTMVVVVGGYPVSKFLILDLQNPRLTKDIMVMEDIQTHYENLVDEVISSHSEDFLLSMTWSMSKEKINTIYRPQLSMLLINNPTIHDKCLQRMPHWIGSYLHDMHSRAYETVAPKIQNYMAAHWPSPRWYSADMTTNYIAEFLTSLNYKLLPVITAYHMDPNLALTYLGHRLHKCQQKHQQDHHWIQGFFLLNKLFDQKQQQIPSSYDLNDINMKHHFFVRFLIDMRSDFVTQMHDRIPDLVPLIQDDLNDQFVDI